MCKHEVYFNNACHERCIWYVVASLWRVFQLVHRLLCTYTTAKVCTLNLVHMQQWNQLLVLCVARGGDMEIQLLVSSIHHHHLLGVGPRDPPCTVIL